MLNLVGPPPLVSAGPCVFASHAVNASHIDGGHDTAGFATLVLRSSQRSGLSHRALSRQRTGRASTTIGPAAPEYLPANDDARRSANQHQRSVIFDLLLVAG